MNKQYKVTLSKIAAQSISEITRYISYDLMSPKAAANLARLIRKEITNLSYMPQRIRLISEEPWHSRGVHQMIVKNYYIYFLIIEEQCMVEILDVTYARQDQKKQLERIP